MEGPRGRQRDERHGIMALSGQMLQATTRGRNRAVGGGVLPRPGPLQRVPAGQDEISRRAFRWAGRNIGLKSTSSLPTQAVSHSQAPEMDLASRTARQVAPLRP